METIERSQTPSLSLLSHQAEEFNFYQAIRMLEGITQYNEKPYPIKYRGVNAQAFTPNFLASIEPQTQGVEVKVNAHTLTGQQGPLPEVFSEMLQRESASGNVGPDAFLNLFNHRFVKLLYDIKKQLDPMLFNETAGQSKLFDLLSATTGYSTTELFDRLPLNTEQLLSFASLLIGNRQNYSALKNIIETVFECKITIDSMKGAWRKLPEKFQTRLGGKLAKVGSGVGLGKKYWDNQAAIEITMTISSVKECRELMPKGDKHNMLLAMLSLITDGHYQINVQLVLDWKNVPKSEIKQLSNMHLGQSSWLKTNTKNGQPLNLPKFSITPKLANKFWSVAA